jgi:hypothetical protein
MMQTLNGKTRPKVTLSAKVIRADGTVECLGIIARTKVPWWEKMFSKLFKGGK